MSKDAMFSEAMEKARQFFERAKSLSLREPAAVSLATVDAHGQPSVRIVLIRGLDEGGFIFFTNSHSRKGTDLAQNPKAALCCYLDSIAEQLRVDGTVQIVSSEESDAYWQKRPRDSQIGAWASDQSRPLSSRAELEMRITKYEQQFPDSPAPRPPHWVGYRLIPHQIEFWVGRHARLHDRTLYALVNGQWTVRLLFP